MPLLRNDSDVSWRDGILLEHFAGAGNPAFWAIRTTSWKYAELDTGELELYDMINDPYELTNVANQPGLAVDPGAALVPADGVEVGVGAGP